MKTTTISAKPQQQKMTRDLPPGAKQIKGGERLPYMQYRSGSPDQRRHYLIRRSVNGLP